MHSLLAYPYIAHADRISDQLSSGVLVYHQ